MGCELWAAVSIRNPSDLEAARAYAAPEVSRILFDAKTPDDALLPGGMGLRFDWKMLQYHRHSNHWALAGGLDPSNVVEAVATTGARMVDVSSGVESSPGIKDVDKIAAFLKAASNL
jgi:phosphoribosylanthranilate isomerase